MALHENYETPAKAAKDKEERWMVTPGLILTIKEDSVFIVVDTFPIKNLIKHKEKIKLKQCLFIFQKSN